MATSSPSKNERREAARAQAEKLRAAQAAKDKRFRLILFGVLGVVVAGLVVFGIAIYNNAQQTLFDEFDGAMPAAADNHGGIQVGATAAGDVNADAPEMKVYLDFMCPYCGDFEDANAVSLDELRTAGDLTVTYHLMANLDAASQGTQFSTRSANAASTVAAEAPEYFVPFVEAIFEQQPAQNTPGLSDEELIQIAVDAGVPQEVADTFPSLTYVDFVRTATQQASREGVGGTPTVFLDGTQVNPNNDVNYYQPDALAGWLASEKQIGSAG